MTDIVDQSESERLDWAPKQKPGIAEIAEICRSDRAAA